MNPFRYVMADEVRLRQVLINLLGNAIKFTETGHIKLNVSLRQPFCCFWFTARVEDTGIGSSVERNKVPYFSRFPKVMSPEHATWDWLRASHQSNTRLMGGDISPFE